MVEQGLFQIQGLRQEQTLSPRQIQSLELLVAPLLDLQVQINQELQTNPALERDGPSNEELAGDPIEELSGPSGNDEDLAGAVAEKDEALASLITLDDLWRDYAPPAHSVLGYDQDRANKRAYFFDSLTSEHTLEEDLLEQLRTSDAAANIKKIGNGIIGDMDPFGYVRTSLEDLAMVNGCTVPEVEDALALVQSFDPPGIGARDLRECLLLQLARMGKKKTTEWKIVDKHLDKIARNRILQVAKALRISADDVYASLEHIRHLQPHPANAIATGDSGYVLPEITVEETDDGYQVRATRDYVPRLRISRAYMNLLASPDTSEEVRAYVREKIAGGNAFMKSLAQRESTIENIVQIIVDEQSDFFDQGEEALRPMTMTHVAECLNLHETTVSRAIANKYVDTPRGLFPLKHFFTGGFRSDQGEMLSNRSVMSKLRQIVDGEDPEHPLSDQRLVSCLAEQGLKVARRTVAKYRDEIGIPASHMRKSFHS